MIIFLFSEDGSNIKNFKIKYLNKKLSRQHLLMELKKMLDIPTIFADIKEKYSNKIKLLFVSRLETNKNCDLLINSLANLDGNLKKKLFFFVVGSGSQLKHLQNLGFKTKKFKVMLNF